MMIHKVHLIVYAGNSIDLEICKIVSDSLTMCNDMLTPVNYTRLVSPCKFIINANTTLSGIAPFRNLQ